MGVERMPADGHSCKRVFNERRVATICANKEHPPLGTCVDPRGRGLTEDTDPCGAGPIPEASRGLWGPEFPGIRYSSSPTATAIRGIRTDYGCLSNFHGRPGPDFRIESEDHIMPRIDRDNKTPPRVPLEDFPVTMLACRRLRRIRIQGDFGSADPDSEAAIAGNVLQVVASDAPLLFPVPFDRSDPNQR